MAFFLLYNSLRGTEPRLRSATPHAGSSLICSTGANLHARPSYGLHHLKGDLITEMAFFLLYNSLRRGNRTP
ncbi:MAG: hypothetical protein CSA96_10475, partial [Bacteroidetes bacterium]